MTDGEGAFTVEIPRDRFRGLFSERSPDLYFKLFQGQDVIASTECSVLWDVDGAECVVSIEVDPADVQDPEGPGDPDPPDPPSPTPDGGAGSDDEGYSVDGTVTSPDRAGVSGLCVQIVDKNVGQDVVLVEARTDERGSYRVGFSAASLRERRKQRPDLQARVHSGKTFLAASEVRYDASRRETLNVLLPAGSAALASEHETLTAAIAAHYRGRLKDLEESEERQDITYLANKTGWDARGIKSVAVSLPAVVGPYTSVNCTLSLLRSTVRRSPLLKDGAYARSTTEDDDRFVDYYGSVQTIVTSSGTNDSGLFEANLHGEQLLPFEGAGADSTWSLRLAVDFPPFDYMTISDVILHVRYTARQGGDVLGKQAITELKGRPHRDRGGSMSLSRVRFRVALRAPVETTDPAGLAACAKRLRPIVTTIRELTEDATTAKPVYSREHCREQILKALRVVEARLDAAAPPEPASDPERGDPAGIGAGPAH